MVARMKVEDRCCKSKAVLGYDLFRPKRTVVTILSHPFCQERQETREIWGGGTGRGVLAEWGKKRDRRKNFRKEEEEKKACNTGAVKTASFLDIIYLSTVEEREKQGNTEKKVERKVEKSIDAEEDQKDMQCAKKKSDKMQGEKESEKADIRAIDRYYCKTDAGQKQTRSRKREAGETLSICCR